MSSGFVQIVPAGAGVLYGVAAAVCDVRTRRIPNRLVVLSLLTAFGLQLLCASQRDALQALLAGVLAALPLLLGYAAGGMGAGDVKLMAAMGVFAGLHGVLPLLLYTTLAGGLFALPLLAQRARALQGRSPQVCGADGCAASPDTLPYGVAIGCGALAVFFRAFGVTSL